MQHNSGGPRPWDSETGCSSYCALEVTTRRAGQWTSFSNLCLDHQFIDDHESPRSSQRQLFTHASRCCAKVQLAKLEELEEILRRTNELLPNASGSVRERLLQIRAELSVEIHSIGEEFENVNLRDIEQYEKRY